MQGVIFDQMRQYAVAELGETGWAMILKRAGRSGQEYDIGESYPDQEFGQVFGQVAQAMNKPLPYVLEGFGEALVVDMVRVYGFLVDQRWSYIDFLLNMQAVLQSAFRLHAPDAVAAMSVRVRQVGPEEISIAYESSLRACAIVRGVCRGAAAHYGVEVAITDETCVLRGDPACVISIRSQP